MKHLIAFLFALVMAVPATGQELDLSSASKVGDMTRGLGLAAVFDGDLVNAGRTETTFGWAGAALGGKQIGKVVVIPPANGFDASGLSSNITLTLRAKAGAAPSSVSDGTVIGSLFFADTNAQIPRTMVSSDKTTSWDYVWVSALTGVWTTFAEVKVFEPEPAPSASLTDVTVYQKACDELFPLPQSAVYVPCFEFDMYVDEDAAALIDFSVNLTHAGNLFYPQYLGAIGVGATVVYKTAATHAGLDAASWQVPYSSNTNGINIDERTPAHYANVSMMTAMDLPAGFYRFSLRMSGHTDGDARDGLAHVLAESGKGLNGYRITVIKSGGAHIVDE